jgi:hypothetical protein
MHVFKIVLSSSNQDFKRVYNKIHPKFQWYLLINQIFLILIIVIVKYKPFYIPPYQINK